ncbi:hypothetical protein [Thiohalorhabdus sp.]|uniref:hypothetical protein n=1 Tax=Thiohalorhabdus sp. TaxID=3094134 RepID=UPI002FC2CBE8
MEAKEFNESVHAPLQARVGPHLKDETPHVNGVSTPAQGYENFVFEERPAKVAYYQEADLIAFARPKKALAVSEHVYLSESQSQVLKEVHDSPPEPTNGLVRLLAGTD